MKPLLMSFFMLLTFTNLALADFEEWSKNHFKVRIGKDSPETFVQKETQKLVNRQSQAFVMKVINLQDSIIHAYVPASLEQGTEELEIIEMSYIPHIWIKHDLKGNLIEFGSSFMLDRSPDVNPRLIEQEIFYFQGENASNSFIANW